jgi:cyclomaltodextrinase / maltogenic alpha-amylase / neopullulanase
VDASGINDACSTGVAAADDAAQRASVVSQRAGGDAVEGGSVAARRFPAAPPLTRRAVVAAGIGAFLAAAGGGLRPALAAARKARAATLWPAEADVWGFSIDVEGTPPNAQLSRAGEVIPTTAGSSGFTAEVPLGPGANAVLATSPAGGASIARTYLARLEERPTARVSLSVVEGAVRLDAAPSEPCPYTAAPIESVSWRKRDGTVLGSGTVLSLRGPWAEGEQYVTASVIDTNGRSDETTVVFVVSAGQPAAVEASSWQPEWVQGAVVYGAIPPLFGAPPLEALTAQLDRLASLGVNVLWLSPIFATTPGEFGYAVTDYFTVRPDYGDLDALRTLVAAAHARGLKVILDIPLNDTSDQHPYYRQTREDRTGSHYWDYYQRTASGASVHYFNWKHLPNLNYDSAEVRRLATEVAAYWLRSADVDGFRCDAAWGVQERRPEFWAQWRAELQRIRPDLLLLAEASAREDVWSASGFSSAYDWTQQLGQWAWQEAFAPKQAPAPALKRRLATPSGSRPFRFLENNDTGARFITRNGPLMTRAAAALLLTLPGIPCIYTGQEIGAAYAPYQQTQPLDWTSDPEKLETYYRSLIEQRLANPAMATGSLTLAEASPGEDVLAYVLAAPSTSLLVAINFSAKEVQAIIQGAGVKPTSLALAPWSWLSQRIG